jgi:EAL domain-containing protein (putative c-di-GMP-specific phosphodiesterase class I)
MTNNTKIVVIDDEAEISELISNTAQNLGLQCSTTTDASTLPELVSPDVTLIMLDLMMPEMDGVEALRLLSELKCRVGIVLMSGVNKRVMETAEKLASSLGLHVVGHLAKPFQLAELEEFLKKEHIDQPAFRIMSKPRVMIKDERLRLAVERDEFVVHYQPQIDIATGSVIGLEALVRWQHPERGLIFPSSFVDRAEELGLIDDIGWLVAHHALGDFEQFTKGMDVLPRLALNASANSLRDLKFPDRLAALLNKYDVCADRIILEITESGLIHDLSCTLDVLTRLRVKGVQLSIDDFGTGYAMMQQLVNIPATELKIDRSFVMNMHLNSYNRVMVEKSIEIGHELGMKVIAEGVETQPQLEFLRQKGCDSAQGYLFSRPLPPLELIRWLNRESPLSEPALV